MITMFSVSDRLIQLVANWPIGYYRQAHAELEIGQFIIGPRIVSRPAQNSPATGLH